MSGKTSDRLYGVPHAEVLYDDPATVWESDIDPHRGLDDEAWKIEEWTVRPPISHMPNVSTITDFIAESAADDQGLDDSYDAWFQAVNSEGVEEVVKGLIAMIAGHVTYRQADRMVREHAVTLDANRQPLLDGAPMYAPTASTLMDALAESITAAKAARRGGDGS